MRYNIAIVISHPIQHFCPGYASWAKNPNIHLKVFFASNLGATKYVDPDFEKEISWNNLYLEEFEHEFLNGDISLPITNQIDALNLEDKLNEFKPDILIFYGYVQQIAKRAHNWAIKNKVKCAYISDAERKQKRPIWKEFLKLPYLYFLFRRINYFLSVGDANEAYYKFYGVPANRIKRMHFPIDIMTYDKAYEQKHVLRSDFRHNHSINDTDIVIAVVGKLVKWKCQNHLIRLLHLMENLDPELKIHLLIAGSGPMEKSWKVLAEKNKSNRSYFLGFVNPIDLPAIYASCDIYIHPALKEPHSLSISEAIYMGCPVILSDTCGSYGINDDVQINKNGLTYKHGDILELQKVLINLLKENKLKSYGDYSHSISRNFQNRSHFKIIEELNEENCI